MYIRHFRIILVENSSAFVGFYGNIKQSKITYDQKLSPTMKIFLFNLLKILFLLFLPFIALIRGAVFFHEQYHLWPWFSILGGILVSALLIFFYIVYLQGHITGTLGTTKSLKRQYWVALVLVLVYCIPGLLFLSAANAKHPSVQQEYRSLHPILRLSVSTLVFAEKKLLITDANRVPEDYQKMGLKTKNHSLHYQQSNGYAHAIDIRTKGHSEFRNFLVSTYFRIMGFNTLRHVGTADHLHISLMSHDRPMAI
jgi:hypothetical protein